MGPGQDHRRRSRAAARAGLQRLSTSRTVLVPAPRLLRWGENFARSHGETRLGVVEGALTLTAADGSEAVARLPFGRSYAGAATYDAFLAEVEPPLSWGVLLVRKGGFALARMAGATMADSKTGQRHVQGRTKAGGQSQQRFSRRRDNQARQAYEAAAEHAVRILLQGLEGADLAALVCGGDHAAVEAVLEDRRLTHLVARRVEPWLPVPDPRRAVLVEAVRDAGSVRMSVTNS